MLALVSGVHHWSHVGSQYLVDGQLLPAWLQVSGVGLTEVFIAVVLLAAVVIH